jgi:hypothetical protein
MSFLDDAISTIGRGLAQTAVQAASDATGFDVGGLLNGLFANQSQGGANLAALAENLPQDWKGSPDQLTMLQNSVTQQAGVVADLGGTLVALSQSVNAITGVIAGIQELLSAINQLELYEAWQQVDSLITGYISATQTSYRTYGHYISNYQTTGSAEIGLLISDIMSTNVGPAVAVTAINNFIAAEGQAQGVLQLWVNMVEPLIANGALDYREAINGYFAYYQRLVYAQLQATNLVLEAYNYQNDPTQAGLAWEDYRSALWGQEASFLNGVVQLVSLGASSPWPKAGPGPGSSPTFSGVHAVIQLNPTVQQTPIGSISGGVPACYYEPSSIFTRAETLLANLYATGTFDRRIVLHMLYLNDDQTNGLVSQVNLSLTSSMTGQISARTATLLGPYECHCGLLDENFFYTDGTSPGFFVKRFVFMADANGGALQDTTYNITNINNTEGLYPIETYISQVKMPFMLGELFEYDLSVDETSPFDFMNFMAYMCPLPGIEAQVAMLAK